MSNEIPVYWRSVEEHAATKEIDRRAEFPPGADELDGATRRDFLKLLGGTIALSGMSGCFTNPPDRVMPYVQPPDGVVPGVPLHYATTLTLDGFGTGVLVASNEGRPTKVEGNPEHPASLGATGVFQQAAVQHLYDPQRARILKQKGRPQAWRQFLAATATRADLIRQDRGAKLRFLGEPSSSPLEAWLRKKILAEFPEARFHAYAPVAHGASYAGTQLAFGKPLETVLDLDKARVIVSLDADFLSVGPFALRYAREFAKHRVPENELNRLYLAEAHHSTTGSCADHRLRVKPSEVQALGEALLNAIGGDAAVLPKRGGAFANHPWVLAAAKDLRSRGAQAVVIAGLRQPAIVHAIAAACNAALKSEAVRYTAPVLNDTNIGVEALAPLVADIKAGLVDTLVVTAYNPVYTAPADLELDKLFDKVPNVIYRGYFEDETARHTGWFLPAAHELEAWGDTRALDGTISLQQPLINPLFNGVTTAEVWASLLREGARGSYKLLREFWTETAPRVDFATWWDKTVQRGVVENSAFAPEATALSWDKIGAAIAAAPHAVTGGLEINFVPDAKIHDGRFADNAWLQELPDPMSKVTWTNTLQLSPKTAEKLGVETESAVDVSVGSRKLTATVYVMPGHADDVASIQLGYGRIGAEMIARELGTNAYVLRTVAAPWFASGNVVSIGGRKRPLSVTQEHWSMDGRPVALAIDAGDMKKKHLPLVSERHAGEEPQPSMYAQKPYDGYKWAMAIDMSRCTGCSACVIACETENNSLIVGADQVRRGREMQWLRIDRYFEGPLDDPKVAVQPMACVHCENAPCEYVCPVNATVHSDEGLNEMVYNRCIGTRYCSNNCPYKVRRFNFLNYHTALQGTEEMAMNPNVTVRGRGVMEKCTFCVQRIESARITTRIEGREIKDQEFTTACAQVCPSQAITFGSLHDKESMVSKLHEDRRSYQVLHELNTRPRTAHLARVRNPNKELG